VASCLIIQPIHGSGLERLRDARIEVRSASAPDMVTVAREIVGATAAITRNAGLDRSAIAAARDLLVLGVHGIGTDPVDIGYADEIGLPVVFTPYANVQAVAEHTIALMLAVMKRIPAADRATRAGKFDFKYNAGTRELCGKTLGIVGYGRIGRRVAATAQAAFELKVLAYSPSADPDRLTAEGIRKCDTLAELLAVADVISLHVPLRDATRQLIDADALAQMKPDTILINTGRGAVVDETALIAALETGRLAGAGLDVFESEAMAADYPLLRLNNVVLSPHLAGSAEECLARTAIEVAEQIIDVLRGRRPANLVNPEVWERRRLASPPIE
jgi:D-3-phosphoglycerate dehydrogenase